MTTKTKDYCGHCYKEIPNSETPMLLGSTVVCANCFSKSKQSKPLEYAAPSIPAVQKPLPPNPVICKVCGIGELRVARIKPYGTFVFLWSAIMMLMSICFIVAGFLTMVISTGNRIFGVVPLFFGMFGILITAMADHPKKKLQCSHCEATIPAS